MTVELLRRHCAFAFNDEQLEALASHLGTIDEAAAHVLLGQLSICDGHGLRESLAAQPELLALLLPGDQ